jgi:hypothetical protein
MKDMSASLRVGALISVVVVTQSACALHAPKPVVQVVPEFSAAAALAALNSESNVLAPGVIYELHEEGSAPILDILRRKPLYEPAGWVDRTQTDRKSIVPLALRNVGRPTVRCSELSWWTRAVKKPPCDMPTPVSIELRVKAAGSEVLLEPMSLVEILNRPMTGLLYNREAESRIQLWRSSLAAALYRQRGYRSVRVALCLSREQASEVSLAITGFIDASAAQALAAEVSSASKVRIAGKSSQEEPHEDGSTTYVFPVVAPVTLRATLRDVQLVDGAIDSRIDFSLAGMHEIAVSANDQMTR